MPKSFVLANIKFYL